MKHLLFFFLACTLLNCSSDDDNTNNDPIDNNIPEATILGRWVLAGFEKTIRYEFTETKRFAIYGVDGEFPTLEEFNQENPDLTGNDWYYENEKVVVDLNFGNLSILTPEFVCDNYAIKWVNDDEETHSVYYREDFDISSCSDME